MAAPGHSAPLCLALQLQLLGLKVTKKEVVDMLDEVDRDGSGKETNGWLQPRPTLRGWPMGIMKWLLDGRLLWFCKP